MELKKYQKRVIADLEDFLVQLHQQETISDAFAAYWRSRQIAVGAGGVSGWVNRQKVGLMTACRWLGSGSDPYESGTQTKCEGEHRLSPISCL